MTDDKERAYIKGRNAAYRSMLAECLRNLDDSDRDAHSWQLERADVVAVLRDLCAEHGDNDWPDSLHLGDVLRKHLEPYLDE